MRRFQLRQANEMLRKPRGVEQILTDEVLLAFVETSRGGFRPQMRSNENQKVLLSALRDVVCGQLSELLTGLAKMVELRHRMHILLSDVLHLLPQFQMKIYGFDNDQELCTIQNDVYHVTELCTEPSLYNDNCTDHSSVPDLLKNYLAHQEEQEEEEEENNQQELQDEWQSSDSDAEGSSSIKEERSDLSCQDSNIIQELELAQQKLDDFFQQNNETSLKTDQNEEDQPFGEGEYSDHEMDVKDSGIAMTSAKYLISRKDFLELIHSLTYNSFNLKISNIAASALHNSIEQYIVNQISSGVLNEVELELGSEMYQELLKKHDRLQKKIPTSQCNNCEELRVENEKLKKNMSTLKLLLKEKENIPFSKEISVEKAQSLSKLSAKRRQSVAGSSSRVTKNIDVSKKSGKKRKSVLISDGNKKDLVKSDSSKLLDTILRPFVRKSARINPASK